uniref:Uncharacterized protein n=1 Tax=viral metagenome TaxID=1070528 RepID=A0A6C0EYP1_9ZZZZ
MSFFKKKFTTQTLGIKDEDEPTISIKNATTSKTKTPTKQPSTKRSVDEFGMPTSPPTPKKKKVATTRKTKTPTKRPISYVFANRPKKLPTIFEREQANALIDSIKDMDDIRYTISSLKPENRRSMIRYATDESKKFETLTPIQTTFLQELNSKIKTEYPHTRMIHEETRPVAELKINWTSNKSKLPRGVIVLVHTHGEFVHSNDLIKYPRDVNDTLESVSTYYLSDIGASACNVREDYKQFDEKFIWSLLREPRLLKEGFSIKDISEKAQEGLKHARFKNINFNKKTGLFQNYFEAGVYNLAVCTKINNIPFLNKNYSCGKRGGEVGGYKLQSIQVLQENELKPLSEIIGREFDCQDEHSSITTFELVKELCKVIDDLEHVLVVDTSCSPFTPSIVKEIFKERLPDSTPHKHRRDDGMFVDVSSSPSPIKSRFAGIFSPVKAKPKPSYGKTKKREIIKTIRPYFQDLVGGKKTKKRRHGRSYKKTKKN